MMNLFLNSETVSDLLLYTVNIYTEYKWVDLDNRKCEHGTLETGKYFNVQMINFKKMNQ